MLNKDKKSTKKVEPENQTQTKITSRKVLKSIEMYLKNILPLIKDLK